MYADSRFSKIFSVSRRPGVPPLSRRLSDLQGQPLQTPRNLGVTLMTFTLECRCCSGAGGRLIHLQAILNLFAKTINPQISQTTQI